MAGRWGGHTVNHVDRRHHTSISHEEILGAKTEAIFSKLLQRGTGGTRIISNAAPAASTAFVKSSKDVRAAADRHGYFAEIIFPSLQDLKRRHEVKERSENDFGYSRTYQTEAYPQGFGEKSARALAREEMIYQLKGSFPAAMLNFTKLRARVEAREGSVEDVETYFAMMWNLTSTHMTAVPRLVVSGSEATRLAALEDRSYHALSAHPGHNGGYRIDMATISPDALGKDVPLNWARMRTTLKAIAYHQIAGDLTLNTFLEKSRERQTGRFGMDLVVDSQPKYERCNNWETTLVSLMSGTPDWKGSMFSPDPYSNLALATHVTAAAKVDVMEELQQELVPLTREVASYVAEKSERCLETTIQVMLGFDSTKQLMQKADEERFRRLEESVLTQTFNVPRYKVAVKAMTRGLMKRRANEMDVPDMYAETSGSYDLDLREFREANISLQMDMLGAINIAVFFVIHKPEIQQFAYKLMMATPRPPGQGKIGVLMRNPELFRSPQVLELGKYLFGDSFKYTLEHIIHNLDLPDTLTDTNIKRLIWDCMSRRAKGPVRRCPDGGWKDLIDKLQVDFEGWPLYYWARVTIGRAHRTLSDGILAPVIAGHATDFLTMVKLAARKRANSWRDYYSARCQEIEECIKDRKDKKRKEKGKTEDHTTDTPAVIPTTRYVPPHLRTRDDVEELKDTAIYLSRTGGYSEEEYKQMVEMQSKSKFYSAIETYTYDNKIVMGVSDEKMHTMLCEFYQARWLSLQVRIEKAKRQGHVFRLGRHEFEEHPWGELRSDLPESYSAMLEFMMSLDGRAWTLPPDSLYGMFRKSISETWGDIAQELATIVEYIREVEDGLAEEQELAMADRPHLSVLGATLSVQPIVLPSQGYRQPWTRPENVITIIDKHGDGVATVDIPSGSTAFHANAQQDPGEPDALMEPIDELSNMDAFLGDDFDAFLGDDSMFASLITKPDSTLEEVEGDYLTYREIWSEIGLAPESDVRMRIAYTLPAAISLDDPHLDPMYGPLICREDIAQTARQWDRRKRMMEYRLGLRGDELVGDDLQVGPSEAPDS